MARITGIAGPNIGIIDIQPQNSGAIQLSKVEGQIKIQPDRSYDFQLPVGIYDIQLYDIRSFKIMKRCGVQVLPTDATLTLEGLLARQ